MKKLDEILKRCEAATPEPWQLRCLTTPSGATVYQIGLGQCTLENEIYNGDFIAHARTDLPLVVKALQKAMAYIKNDFCICESIEQYTCEKCEILDEINKLLDEPCAK